MAFIYLLVFFLTEYVGMQAKKFVESLPQVLKEGLPKEDAEKIQKVFEAHGAVVALE